MATAAIQVPPSNKILPGSRLLATVPYPQVTESTLPTDPGKVASDWITSFNRLINHGDSAFSSLFLKESCWRDLLCLTWDFHTLQGPEEIAASIGHFAKECRIKCINLDTSSDHKKPKIASADFAGNMKAVQAFLEVETDVGKGKGLVRLLPDSEDGQRWKAFTLLTTLQELKGYEESTNRRRPTGVESDLDNGRRNWKDLRIAEENFEGDREPVVLILGAGQAGLSLAARLRQLGVDTLIIDQNHRVGDNWRNRYHQLVLHDSVWYDHMPYLNFPPSWPVFTPKDKLAEWFENYANALELNVWTSTTLTTSKWDDACQQWTITLEREKQGEKEKRTFHPRHIVLATGLSGEAYLPSHIEGLDDFKGDRLLHSSQFSGPEQNADSKKAVVVGSSNSAHDIAKDYYDHGYDVTMVQRSSTLVVTSQTLIDVTMKGLYAEDGPPVEDANLINMSIPSPVAKRLQIEATQEMMQRDAALLRGLTAAGFAIDSGPDGSGLWMKYLSRGGGYYIDVGASQLIADGKIKIKQGQEIRAVKAHGILMADGAELEADEIVFATGYENMRETARKVFGDELAERLSDVWGFDDEGETRAVWRKSGHPGFWFFGGNLALCRFYSRLLALQIKAQEVGLVQR